MADTFSARILAWPATLLAALFSLIRKVVAQAPVSDLTQYPSGLASIAVVAYYAIQCEKDDLPSRRRLAGLGIEHCARDVAVGPRKMPARDLHLKGITIHRNPPAYQRESWNWKTCGKKKGGLFYNNLYDNRAILIDGKAVIEACASTFADMPEKKRLALSKFYGFGTAGHTVATLAAFCQIAGSILEAAAILQTCVAVKDDWNKMVQK